MSSRCHSCSCIFFLLLSNFLIIAVNCLEGSYFFYQQPQYPRDCKEVYEQCSSDNSCGVHTIKPDGYPKPFEVYCDNEISTGGWTVIHRQIDGSLTFKRTWEDYRNGFGFLSREFYIGNDKLSHLTNQAVYELHIDMMLSNGSHFYIRYDRFRIGDEWSQYSLVDAEEFSGNSTISEVCTVPLGPANGRWIKGSNCRDGRYQLQGCQLSYTCNEGYTPASTNVVYVCSEPEWDKVEEPLCNPGSCDNSNLPGLLEKHEAELDDFTDNGFWLQVRCKNGLRLIAGYFLACINGQWHGNSYCRE